MVKFCFRYEIYGYEIYGRLTRFMGVYEIYGRVCEIYGSLRDLWELRDLWGVQLLLTKFSSYKDKVMNV